MLWLHRQAVNTRSRRFKCPQQSAVAVLIKSSGGNVALIFFNWLSWTGVPVSLKGCLLPWELTRLHWSFPLSTPLSLSSFFSFSPQRPCLPIFQQSPWFLLISCLTLAVPLLSAWSHHFRLEVHLKTALANTQWVTITTTIMQPTDPQRAQAYLSTFDFSLYWLILMNNITHSSKHSHTLMHVQARSQRSHFIPHLSFMPINQLLWFCIFQSMMYHRVTKLHLLNTHAFSRLLVLLSEALWRLCVCMWFLEYSIIFRGVTHDQGLNESEGLIKWTRQT